jgi:hypothetical protein
MQHPAHDCKDALCALAQSRQVSGTQKRLREMRYPLFRILSRCRLARVLSRGMGKSGQREPVAGRLCLASNVWSIPEVGGDLVAYFNPEAQCGMYELIERHIFGHSLRIAKQEYDESIVPSWRHTADQIIANLSARRA